MEGIALGVVDGAEDMKLLGKIDGIPLCITSMAHRLVLMMALVKV